MKRHLTLRGRTGRRAVTFPCAALLAPMEGITDRCFRGLVLGLGDAGGACTEFVRITTGPMRAAVLARELGDPHPAIPVGLQILTPGPDHLAETAARAEGAGAAWVDLNFGCPVKRVFHKCAGSALLARPDRIAAIVAEAARAVEVPVSAKIRAGIDDDSLLDEVLHAAAGAGAAMVTLHARLRRDPYSAAARWDWIARAASLLHARYPGVALVGNGGIDRAPDAARMVAATGCDGVMVGRAAFADPWIFREIRGGPPASAAEARAFALRYARALLSPGALRGGFGRVKQFVGKFRAGGLFEGREREREALLRSDDPAVVLAWLAGGAGDGLRHAG